MAPRNMSDGVKPLPKLTVLLMLVSSTLSTKQCSPKITESGGYVIRNVGIKLCQLKCDQNGQCQSIKYNIDNLACRLLKPESKKIKKKGFAILARNHLYVPSGSCTSSKCSFGQRCLVTRSGKALCAQDEKQNYMGESPQHKADKQETYANSPIHEACRKGDLRRVRLILSRGLRYVNIREEKHGRTPLMVAAQEGHCSIFDFLIRKGANMSEVDDDCKNALHWACKGGHVGMVECILGQYNITINAGNMRGIGKDKQVSPLIQAAWKGYKDVVEFLVCTGSNVSEVNNFGNSVLHIACSSGHLDVVTYLLSQSSIDINSVEKFQRTPLILAAAYGHRYIFEFLLQNGANVSQVDGNGNNVLHYVCSGGHLNLLKLLLSQSSIDINGRSNDGKTPLMVVAQCGKIDVFDFLVSMGANMSHVDDRGRNILHLATSNGRFEMVKHILSQNLVDINARDKDGRTAAMIAKHQRRDEVYNLLVS